MKAALLDLGLVEKYQTGVEELIIYE